MMDDNMINFGAVGEEGATLLSALEALNLS
jgi:hypothetical protein